MRGTAKMTSGGLMKKHLTYNNSGKIVSRKASKTAKKLNKLVKAGYTTRKGQFGAVRTMTGGMKFDTVMIEIKYRDKKAYIYDVPLKRNPKTNEEKNLRINVITKVIRKHLIKILEILKLTITPMAFGYFSPKKDFIGVRKRYNKGIIKIKDYNDKIYPLEITISENCNAKELYNTNNKKITIKNIPNNAHNIYPDVAEPPEPLYNPLTGLEIYNDTDQIANPNNVLPGLVV